MTTRKTLKALAKEQIRGNIWKLFLMSLVVGLIAAALTLPGTMASMGSVNRGITDFYASSVYPATAGLQLSGPAVAFNLLGTVLAWVVSSGFAFGMCRVYLNLTDGIRPSFEVLFDGFRHILKMIAVTFLVGLFTFLWTLLLIIPGIVKSYSYSMAIYIQVENPDLSPLEAIRRSKEMMVGHKFEFFVLELSFILWILLGAITFGLAYIYIIPYMEATFVNFYKAVSQEGAPAQA